MKLALLGDCDEIRYWLPFLLEQSRHSIPVAADVSPETREILDGCELLERGEQLLDSSGFDAVLCAGKKERCLQAVKQLAAQGVPVVLFPSADQGTAFLYEMSLIRDDNRVQLFVLFPLRHHPLVRQFQEALTDQKGGKPIQWELMRREYHDAGESRVSIGTCDRRMLGDVDLLRQLSGNYSRVTAIRSGADESSVVAQTVSLAGESLPEAVWTIRGDSKSDWQLSWDPLESTCRHASLSIL